jgi:hypothetical protein
MVQFHPHQYSGSDLFRSYGDGGARRGAPHNDAHGASYTLRIGGVSVASRSPWQWAKGFSLSVYLAYLRRFQRTDERTRTADLVSLGVCGQWLLRVAPVCKSRISKGFSVPSIAHDCRALRPG